MIDRNCAMRVVGLSSTEWAGRYLFHELALAKIGLTHVVFESDPLRRARLNPRNALAAARVHGRLTAAKAFLGFYRGFDEAISWVGDRRSAPTVQNIKNLGVTIHSVPDARSLECQQLLKELQPDIVVICGTPILPKCILEVASLCTLNIHTSVLPHYRGGGSLFWPLFFRDTEPVGFTIHEAVAKVDAGRFLLQEKIAVGAGDTPAVLLKRCFRAAAPHLAQILREFQTGRQPDWKRTQREVDFAWRSPDRSIRRYFSGKGESRAFSVLKRIARKAYSPSPKGNGIGIFYLHRILDPATPLWNWRRVLGHPTAEEILRRIRYLKQHFEVISISEALDLIGAGKKITGRFAVLTVDDGYKDFVTRLLPILEAEQAPATLFVCSGAIEQGTVWYQQLYDLIEGVKSNRLRVPFADRELYFGEVRQRVLTIEKFLAAHFKRVSISKARIQLAELLGANPVDKALDAEDAFCTVDELAALRQSRLVELHLHSHYHHPFERLSVEEAADDISRCTQFFRTQIGVNSKVVCYPNGECREDLLPTLQANGIQWGLTTRSGVERGEKCAPFFLRRLGLDNAPFDWFKHMVSRQFRPV